MDRCLGELDTVYGDHLPSDKTVRALCECDLLMDLPTYLELYAAPVRVELESEKVWPVNPLLNI
jgi:hypothetical protein